MKLIRNLYADFEISTFPPTVRAVKWVVGFITKSPR